MGKTIAKQFYIDTENKTLRDDIIRLLYAVRLIKGISIENPNSGVKWNLENKQVIGDFKKQAVGLVFENKGIEFVDEKGKVGIGVAKGKDVAQSIEKATASAKKDLINVPIVNETIPHQVEAKFGASKVLLKPQIKGRGLVAGGTVRVICTLAGIRNISSKIITRSGNKLNNAQATIRALKKLKY